MKRYIPDLAITIVVIVVACLLIIGLGVYSGIEVTCHVMVPDDSSCLRTVVDYIVH